jgi:xylulokinase
MIAGARTRRQGGGDDLLLTLDVGTSGAHAAAFDLDGRRRFESRRSYPTVSAQPGWAEQDALAWRSASLSALGQVARAVGSRARVHAIGLTGQCPSVVLVDSAHRPIRPGLIYRDNRAVEEAKALRRAVGDEGIHRRTGHVPAAFHILPKLGWLARHEPDAFGRGRFALQPRDWLGLVLTGEARTDGTHAAGTLAFDLASRTWSAWLAEVLAVDVAVFPPLAASTDVIGSLRPAIARRLGLAESTPVVLGGADSQACALGVGVVAEGPLSEMAGSSTCLNSVVGSVLPELAITHYPHVVGGRLTTETGINTSGAAVAWAADLLYGGRAGRARAADYAVLDAEAASVPPGASDVLALAVLGDGERDAPDLRGALTGLALTDRRGVLMRALLEGVAFAIRAQVDLLRGSGSGPSELRISGGGTRLSTWNRIKADVTGLPVRAVSGDAAAAGVAMLAGIGTGLYSSVEEAIRRCVHPETAIDPDPRRADFYAGRYAAWCELRAASVVARAVGE